MAGPKKSAKKATVKKKEKRGVRSGDNAFPQAGAALEGMAAIEAVFAVVGEKISIQDTSYRILFQNQVSKDLDGDHAGEYCYRAYQNRDSICEQCGLAMTLVDGKVHKGEKSRTTEQGKRYYEIITSPVKDASGGIVAGIELVRDITERKRAETEAVERSVLVRQIMDTAHVGIGLLDTAGRFTRVNRHMAGLFGRTVEEMVGSVYVDHIHPSQQEAGRQGVRALMTGAMQAADTDRLYQRKDGSPFWGHLTCNRLFDAKGGLLGLIGTIADITERKHAEARGRENESRLNLVLDNVGACIFMKDGQYRYTYVNRKTADLFGRRQEDIVGKSDADLFDAASTAEVMRSDRPVVEEGRTITREEQNLNTRGDVPRTYWTVKLPLLSDTGAVLGLCGISTDITALKQAELEREQYFKLFQNANDLMVMADPNGAFKMVNPACVRTLGYSPEELMGKPFIDFVHPGDKQSTLDEMARQQRQGYSLNFENRYVCKDGSTRWLSWRAAYNDQEKTTYATARDITELKKAEAEREQFFRFFTTSNDLMCVAGTDGYFKIVNPAWTAVLGYEPGELLAQPLTEFIHPDDVGPTTEELKRQARGNSAVNFINRYQCKDGSYKWMEWKATPARDGVVYGIGRDITERRAVEERIERNEQFIRNILDTVDEGFIVIDRDYRILTANKAYCSQAGAGCDDVIGKHCYEVSHRTSTPCYEAGEECAVRAVFAAGEPRTVSHKHADADGRLIYVETKAYPMKDGSGKIVSVIETVSNITEKHLLEEERLKTQKLESIGTLAGGIAHDFNNLLQGVFGYISLAKLKQEDREKSTAALEQAEKALHQSVNLTSQLLTFSKGGRPVRKRISLQPVIENAVRFALSGSRTDYRFAIDPDLRQVDGDAGQLGQVIQNIVLNADQAMPTGGSVVISAWNAPRGAVPRPGCEPGDAVEIVIEDSGIGIPERYLDKIFDPYFTTKEKGSGLGLATSYSIVKNHNGCIRVVSEAGKGTAFSIFLPAVAGTPEAVSPSPGRSASGDPSALRILVMDDEDIIRMLSEEMLQTLGHSAEVAAHGEEALKKYRAAADSGRPFDAVILDYTIRGGMGGAETIRQLREIDPRVKAIVSSGYSDDDTVINYRKNGFRAFLKKPYDLEELQKTLHDLLG